MKKRVRRIVASISVALLLFVYYNYDYKYVPQYEIVDDINKRPYAKYRLGNVYIVKSLDEIDDLYPNDVIILDQRLSPDPNIKIISSHLINDKDARNDILEIISKYELDNPTEWNRTIESMRIEWFVHNVLYFFNYERGRTMDVDLDNEDEIRFKNRFLEKLLKL